MFFQSSTDLLLIVLAFCLLWITVFLSWLIYQAARLLRNTNELVENVMDKLGLIAEAIEFIRGRVDKMASGMGAVSGMVGTLVEKFVIGKLSKTLDEKTTKKRTKKTTRKKK